MSAWDWQLIRIHNQGMEAFEQGKKREGCPYQWGRTGFARQRWDYWHRGFDDACQIASDQRLFDKARADALNKAS